MGRLAEEVASHRAALESLRDELARARDTLGSNSTGLHVLSGTAAALRIAGDAVDTLSTSTCQDGFKDPAALEKILLDAASSLSSCQAEQGRFRDSLAVAAGQKQKASFGDSDRQTSASKSKAKPLKGFDFSAFTKARWEAEKLKGARMLGEIDKGGDGAGGSNVKVWVNEMPRPYQEDKACSQVKGRHIMQNTVEKIRKVYSEMALSGQVDRVGFIRSANLARFCSLATERSDCPSSKKGGDLGWICKKKADSKIDEVAFVTPKGGCSPPFKSSNGYHVFFCEDRKG